MSRIHVARRLLVAATVAALTVVGLGPAAQAAESGSVYLIQGVAGSTPSPSVDGKVVRASAAAKSIVGPLRLTAGKHTITADAPGTDQDVTATITVPAGGNVDAVVHRTTDATAAPVVTTYRNDLSPIASGSGRLTVAHTAAVGPADIRVKNKVLFANVANGEELTLTVPAASYPVSIVPTATTGPVVLGPVNLPVAKGALTRVFAIGVAATGSMDAVVQVLPVPTRGSGKAPTKVNAGDGGQAAALVADSNNELPVVPVLFGAGVLAAGFAVRRRVTNRS